MILYENRLPKRDGATFHPHYPHHGGVTVSFKLRELTQTFKINKTLRHQTGPFLFVPLRLHTACYCFATGLRKHNKDRAYVMNTNMSSERGNSEQGTEKSRAFPS